jgi:hypothetical protein
MSIGVRGPAATDEPYACPTNAQAQSEYSVAATVIDAATIQPLISNAASALGAGGPVAGVLPASSALSPASVAQGLLDMAKEELGAYFASVALEPGNGEHRMFVAGGDVYDGAGHSLVTAYPVSKGPIRDSGGHQGSPDGRRQLARVPRRSIR